MDLPNFEVQEIENTNRVNKNHMVTQHSRSQALTTRVHAPFLTTPESSFPLCYKMFFPLLQNISVAKRRHHRAQTGGGRRWRRGGDSAVERSDLGDSGNERRQNAIMRSFIKFEAHITR